MKEQAPPLAFIALFFGAAGFIAGVLMAPKSGRETRQQIAEKSARMKERAMSASKEFKASAGRTVDRAKSAASESANDAKATMRRAKSSTEDINENI